MAGVFLPVMWETARSMSHRARWRKQRAEGTVPAGSEPNRRFSALHLRRFATDDERMMCGARPPESPDRMVSPHGDELRTHRCVLCATEAACETDHRALAGEGGKAWTCSCGTWLHGETPADRMRAHREHVLRVVRRAIERERGSDAEAA